MTTVWPFLTPTRLSAERLAMTGELTELPIGMQLLGKRLDEGRILQIAHVYEQSTEWHKARPECRRR